MATPRFTISSVESCVRSCVLPSMVEDDRPARRPHHAHDALHERALAVAVGAEQRDGLPLRNGRCETPCSARTAP